MRKKNGLLVVFVILSAFVIGFMIGISVKFPPVDGNKTSGTIGKVSNYLNTKATEADIQLKNELLDDSTMLKYVKNYMNFFYVRAIEFGKNIDFAVTEANSSKAFKTRYAKQIAALENYGKFLSSARKDLLLAVSACLSIEETDPVLLRRTIIHANNIIAQMNYRNSSVINFITELDSFIQEAGESSYPGLNKAHDLLTKNEIVTSIIMEDKVLLKFFENKTLYDKNLKSLNPADLKETIKQDMNGLGVGRDIKSIEAHESPVLESYYELYNQAPEPGTTPDQIDLNVPGLENFLNSKAFIHLDK